MTEKYSEEEIIKALKNKDSEAFKYVYQTHYARLKSVCYGIVHNNEDAEDIVQEVFIDLYDSVSRFQEKSTLSTWLYRIVLNKSYNFLRSKKVRDIFSRFEEKLSQQPDQVEDEDEKTRQINDLHRAIEALPERQAKVFTLFFYEKMSQKEIAEVLKLNSVTVVEQLIFRAKQNIKKTMKFNGN
ncbi:MAG: RNA polymerase sigma factor [Bacteroidales bacterium]|nr:RNA polymerase sigma factor [Bacteroidales bacterium]